MSLAQITSTTFSMPPEPEAWKQSVAMGVLVLAGIVALGKMILDCARPTPNSAPTSFALATASLIVTVVVTISLRLDAPRESDSSNSRAIAAIVVVVLWVTSLGVAVISSTTLDGAKRVVITLVGMFLASLFLMTATLRLAGARIVAPRTQCKNNAKSIGAALLKIVKANGELPPAIFFQEDAPRSWRVELLPWLDQKVLRDQYQDDRPWDDADSNAQVARAECRMYQCPCSDLHRDERGFALTDYAAVIGPKTVWSENNRTAFPDIADGQSSTVMIVEASGQMIPWAEPKDADAQQLKIGVNLDGAARGHSARIASGYHAGGCHVVLADGAARFLSNNIDPKLLTKLLTADGDESMVNEEF